MASGFSFWDHLRLEQLLGWQGRDLRKNGEKCPTEMDDLPSLHGFYLKHVVIFHSYDK
jgi:hypothetical protein